MRNTVGISHRLKRAWLDDLLDRLVQTRDEKELRAFVDQRLREELPGKDSRAKAAGILLRIWSGVDTRHVALRDRAVAMLPRISGQERIWLHWGMAALAYPFFRDLAEVIGRMLTLQDDITNAQVQARLKTAWGDRETSKEAAGKLITSMVDWEVLRATKKLGHFLLARKMSTSVTELQLWLLEAMLSASASDEIEAQQLLRLPELFPFALTVGVADLRRDAGFNIHRQGLDTDMVSIRRVKIEGTLTEKAKKPKKQAPPKVDEPTLFDRPTPTAAPSPSINEAVVADPSRSSKRTPLTGGGFDITYPRFTLTGQERSFADLTKPDERSIGHRLEIETLQAPYLAIESLLPTTTPPKLRERIDVSRNLAIYGFFCYEFHAVSLFWSVSSIEMALKLKFEELNPGPIELRRKLDVGEEEKCRATLTELEDKLRMKWKIVDLSFFDYSFKSLLMWAFRKGVLPEDIEIPVQEIVNSYNNRFALKLFPTQAQKAGLLGHNPTLAEIRACWESLSDGQRKHYEAKPSAILIEELPRFRNMMAHPKHFNLVTPPRSPLSAFKLLTDIVSRLWPEQGGEQNS